jgi:hypothetical protein
MLSAAVVYAGFTYLIYKANYKAAEAAKTAADTGRYTLRLQAGAVVRFNEQMGWYNLGENKRPYVVVMVQNDGPSIARHVAISGRVQFRDSIPTDFSVGIAKP